MWPWVHDLNFLGFIFVGKKISKGLAGSNIPRMDRKWFPNTKLEERKCKSSVLYNDTLEVSAKQPVLEKKPVSQFVVLSQNCMHRWIQDGERSTKSRERQSDPAWLALASCLFHCRVFYSIHCDNHSWGWTGHLSPRLLGFFCFQHSWLWSIVWGCPAIVLGLITSHLSLWNLKPRLAPKIIKKKKEFHLLSHIQKKSTEKQVKLLLITHKQNGQ